MRAFVAGATGVLGRRLVREFCARGHAVVGLTRNERGDDMVRLFGGDPRRADLFDPESLARAAEGCEVVVHAATAIPTKVRTGPSDWTMNDRIRREGTRALTAAAGKVGARVYLQQSVAWVIRPPDGGPYDEDSPPNPDRILASAVEGERIARDAGERFSMVAGVLRCGLFYSADSAHTRTMGDGLLRRRGPIIGTGECVWSIVHVDDAASAFVAAAESSRSGLWHVVDDQPVTVAELLRAFAERLGAPAPRRVSPWLARLFVGRETEDFFLRPFRTSNARFRRDVGWAPRFPTYREGLDEIVAAWRAEGAFGLEH